MTENTQLHQHAKYYFVLVTSCILPLIIVLFFTRPQMVAHFQANTTYTLNRVSQPGLNEKTIEEHTARPYSNQNEKSTSSLLKLASPEIAEQFESIELAQTHIRTTLTSGLDIIFSSDANNLEIELKRLDIILNGFDFDSIDATIVEIDVRYKLPVLRSTRSKSDIPH